MPKSEIRINDEIRMTMGRKNISGGGELGRLRLCRHGDSSTRRSGRGGKRGTRRSAAGAGEGKRERRARDVQLEMQIANWPLCRYAVHPNYAHHRFPRTTQTSRHFLLL